MSAGHLIRSVSLDYAQAVLMQQNITAIRRIRKSDNNRIARAVGATVVNRVEDLREADVGTKCGLFHVEKLGDEWVPSSLALISRVATFARSC